MAAENKKGFEKEKAGKQKINFGAGEDEGNNTTADGAENGAGFDGKINFGGGGGADANTFRWVLNWRGLEVDKIIAVKGV